MSTYVKPVINRLFDEYKKFIEVWQTSNTAEEVSERLSMDIGTIKTVVLRLRRNDVPLKFFHHGRRKGTTAGKRLTPKMWQRLKDFCREVNKSQKKV